MSLKSTIPKNSRLSVVGGIFKGVFNSPSAGKYDFTNYTVAGTRGNYSVPLGLNLRPNYLYFFHQLNFSLSIDEGTYLTAIDSGTVPTLTIKDSTTNKTIFNQPFRMFRYFENAAIDTFHYNLNLNDELIADFQCILNQVAEIVGVGTIYAQASLSIYEIMDHKYIEEFKKESK
jgi:hypothetical protein